MAIMSESIGQLAAALAQAQAELVPAKKDSKNPAFDSKYADLASCFDAVRSILPKYKLAVSQSIQPATGPCVSVITVLMHESGEWISGNCELSISTNGRVNAAQAAGSAITYARRYGLAAIVGLATDDDDGNSAGEPIAKNTPARPSAPRNAKSSTPQGETQKSPANGLTNDEKWALVERLKSRGYSYKVDPAACCDFVGKILGKPIRDLNEVSHDALKVFLSATEESDIPA